MYSHCAKLTMITFVYNICRGKKVRVFICGDYEFLCKLYGLSGASGNKNFKYIFLWLVNIYANSRPALLPVVLDQTRSAKEGSKSTWSY